MSAADSASVTRARHVAPPAAGSAWLAAAHLAWLHLRSRQVPAALAAFTHGEPERLRDLAAASQLDAERWLGNQIPETSALVAIARECGAFAATSFGAGFGGSVWALVRAEDATSVAERALERYRARFRGLERVDWFSARPSPALVALGP